MEEEKGAVSEQRPIEEKPADTGQAETPRVNEEVKTETVKLLDNVESIAPPISEVSEILQPAASNVNTETPEYRGVKKDGTPALKRGRKPIIRTEGAPSAPNAPNAPTPDAPDNSPALGMTLASATVNVATIVMGKDWQPDNEAELQALADADAAWIKSKGWNDIPPGAGVLIAHAAYAAKRFTRPTTIEKMKAAWVWIKLKFQKKKEEKTPEQKPDAERDKQ